MAKRPTIFNAEDAPQVESIPAPTAAKPPTLQEALAQLQAARNLPTSTDSEREIRAAKVKVAEKIFGDLQQGLPVVQMTSDNYAASHTSSSDDLRMTRLRIAARSNPDVAWLLNQIESK